MSTPWRWLAASRSCASEVIPRRRAAVWASVMRPKAVVRRVAPVPGTVVRKMWLTAGVKSTRSTVMEPADSPGPVAVRMGRGGPWGSAAAAEARLLDMTVVEEQLSMRAWMNGVPGTAGWPRVRVGGPSGDRVGSRLT